MDKNFVQEIEQQLNKEKELLRKDLESVSSKDIGDHVPGERAATFPNYGDDALDENSESPAEVSEYEVNVDVTNTLEKRLQEVNAALLRIKENKFGECAKCQKEIETDRLNANPAATTCVQCEK